MPTRGKPVAVFGNFAEAVVFSAVVVPAAVFPAPLGAGVGAPLAIKTVPPDGSVPVTCVCCDTDVTGVSTIFVAVTFMPFFRPQASVSLPSTMNFWPSGIMKA